MAERILYEASVAGFSCIGGFCGTHSIPVTELLRCDRTSLAGLQPWPPLRARLFLKSDRVVQGSVQLHFENLQGWGFHNLFVKPVPMLKHPPGQDFFSLAPVSNSLVATCAHCFLSSNWPPPGAVWLCLLFNLLQITEDCK